MQVDPGNRFGFVLIPNFSLGAYSAAVETLRLANHVAGETLYTWQTYSLEGEPIAASNQVQVLTEPLPEEPVMSTFLLCGGLDTEKYQSRRLDAWLRQISRRNVKFCFSTKMPSSEVTTTKMSALPNRKNMAQAGTLSLRS